MWKPATIAAMVLLAANARGEEMTVTFNAISGHGVGDPIGSVTFSDSRFGGTLVRPDLSGLEPGIHGFHVHQNPDCGAGIKAGERKAGLAAGGHFDPGDTGGHQGPYGDGHLGDLPALYVAQDGTASVPTLAPRIQVDDLRGHAVIVHKQGDNYSDEPAPLGGGGPRVACGVAR